eukprot:1142190-Pelagomonas_calceolata.AAC.11
MKSLQGGFVMCSIIHFLPHMCATLDRKDDLLWSSDVPCFNKKGALVRKGSLSKIEFDTRGMWAAPWLKRLRQGSGQRSN